MEVAGATIRYLLWAGPGGAGSPTLLVHGGAAHAQWWAPLAARLDPAGTVAAMDLSGHGLSDWREQYSVTQWGDEILAVARALGGGRVTLVGHSMGGIVSADVSTRFGQHFSHVVSVDAPVWADAPAPEGVLASMAVQPVRWYADADEARARFRLIPPQDALVPWYVDHVAWHGLCREARGWRWRFDPRIFANPTGEHRIARFEGTLADARCPVTVVMGERSYLADEARNAFASSGALGHVPLVFVPDASHHIMLDQPMALLRVLRALSYEEDGPPAGGPDVPTGPRDGAGKAPRRAAPTRPQG